MSEQVKDSKKQRNKNMHVPMRTCIVTRQKLPKSELARFVFDKDSKKIVFDPSGKISGRGANISKSLDVFEEGINKSSFNRAFKMKISAENIEEMRKSFKDYLDVQQKKSVRISSGKMKI